MPLIICHWEGFLLCVLYQAWNCRARALQRLWIWKNEWDRANDCSLTPARCCLEPIFGLSIWIIARHWIATIQRRNESDFTLKTDTAPQAGGLDALRKDSEKLHKAVDFATACGAFTTTQPGGIDAQPSQEQAENLLKKAPHAEKAVK